MIFRKILRKKGALRCNAPFDSSEERVLELNLLLIAYLVTLRVHALQVRVIV